MIGRNENSSAMSRCSLLTKELEINPSIKVWTDLKQLWAEFPLDIEAEFIEVLKKLVSIEILKQLWSNLFDCADSLEFSNELVELSSLLHAARILSNRIPMSFDMSDFVGEKHIEKFVHSLLLFCNQQTSIPHNFIAKVISDLGDVFQLLLVLKVTTERFDADALFASCTSQTTLHLSVLLLRRCALNSLLLQDDNVSIVLRSLMQSSLRVYSVAEVLHVLIFKIKWNSLRECTDFMVSKYASCIAAAFPSQELEVAYHSSAIWSEKSFVDNKGIPLKSLLSYVVIHCLTPLGSGDVLASVNDGVSLCTLLSSGISHYLDVADKSTRILGMRVATALSETLGNKIQFEELVKVDTIPSSSSFENSTSASITAVSEDEAVFRQDADNSSEDSDSDLEPFDFDMASEVVSGPNELQTNYLTVCLSMLRAAEDKPDAAKKHLAALARINDIMSSDLLPYDSKDLCVPLANQLLILVDHFNQEGFESLKRSAINALLVAHPSLVVPALTKCLLSPDCALGLRIECMSLLSDAAQALHQRSSNNSSSDSSDEVFSTVNSILNKDVKNTTVTHPKRLLAKSRPTVYYRNTFAAVSHLFFVPLCTILAPKTDLGKSVNAVGLDTILPSKAFCALTTVLQCSLNTLHERRYALEALRLSYLYRNTSDLELKRSLLSTALTAVTILTRKSTSNVRGWSDGSSVLSSLTSIAQSQLLAVNESSEDSDVSLDANELQLMMEVCEWVMSSVADDADDQSRLIKQLLLKCVQEALH